MLQIFCLRYENDTKDKSANVANRRIMLSSSCKESGVI